MITRKENYYSDVDDKFLKAYAHVDEGRVFIEIHDQTSDKFLTLSVEQVNSLAKDLVTLANLCDETKNTTVTFTVKDA